MATNYEYTAYNWPKRHTLVFPVPSFTDVTAPVYPTGNLTIPWKPAAGHVFKLARATLIGNLSLVGTGVILRTNIYNASVAAGNIALTMDTTTTDVPVDVSAETTAVNQAGKDLITENDGIIARIDMKAGDNFTWLGGTLYIEFRYQ